MKPPSKGVYLLIYNLAIFAIACGLLFVIKHKPEYKIGSIIIVVGIVIANISSIINYRMYEAKLKKLRDKQLENIVLGYCPDYWTKKLIQGSDGVNEMVCANEFKVQTEDGEKEITYRFGNAGTTPQVSLEELNGETNVQKCNEAWVNDVPWVELKNKCLNSGF
jgi:hypothetical protein